MRYLLLSIIFAIGCQSAPKRAKKSDFWIGCMHSYIKLKRQVSTAKFNKEASEFCEKQERLAKSVKVKGK
jgi:hypothetical protein